jgi:hypothetical protein
MEGSLVAYKVFTNGSVLNASEVNENLMNQSVITFSSATARSSAITSPIEGMITYLEDSNSYQTWNGSAWVGLVPQSGNAIINGAFDIWQRGTTFTNPAQGARLADRWRHFTGSTGATKVFSRESFTPNELNAASFGESPFYFRLNQSVAGTGDTFNQIDHQIEDVRTLAGQTITFSFYAKAASSTTLPSVNIIQNFGTGGSSSVSSNLTTSLSISTVWTRYSFTVNLPSISGKTITSNSALVVQILLPNNATFTLDIWGVQVEAGSVATPFKRNANTLQGELAACQRYYVRYQSDSTDPLQSFAFGTGRATTFAFQTLSLPVEMRRSPTAIEFASNLELWDGNTAATAVTSLALDAVSSKFVRFTANTASGLTQYRPYTLRAANSSTAFVGFTAEL